MVVQKIDVAKKESASLQKAEKKTQAKYWNGRIVTALGVVAIGVGLVAAVSLLYKNKGVSGFVGASKSIGDSIGATESIVGSILKKNPHVNEPIVFRMEEFGECPSSDSVIRNLSKVASHIQAILLESKDKPDPGANVVATIGQEYWSDICEVYVKTCRQALEVLGKLEQYSWRSLGENSVFYTEVRDVFKQEQEHLMSCFSKDLSVLTQQSEGLNALTQHSANLNVLDLNKILDALNLFRVMPLEQLKDLNQLVLKIFRLRPSEDRNSFVEWQQVASSINQDTLKVLENTPVEKWSTLNVLGLLRLIPVLFLSRGISSPNMPKDAFAGYVKLVDNYIKPIIYTISRWSGGSVFLQLSGLDFVYDKNYSEESSRILSCAKLAGIMGNALYECTKSIGTVTTIGSDRTFQWNLPSIDFSSKIYRWSDRRLKDGDCLNSMWPGVQFCKGVSDIVWKCVKVKSDQKICDRYG